LEGNRTRNNFSGEGIWQEILPRVEARPGDIGGRRFGLRGFGFPHREACPQEAYGNHKELKLFVVIFYTIDNWLIYVIIIRHTVFLSWSTKWQSITTNTNH
jgi:hypothetical protein